MAGTWKPPHERHRKATLRSWARNSASVLGRPSPAGTQTGLGRQEISAGTSVPGWLSSARRTGRPKRCFACGDAGIIVCSIHPDGLPTWQWIGQPSSRSTFNEDWCHFLDRPGSRHAYRHWAAAERRRAIRFCALFLGLGRRGANHMLLRAGQWATMDSDMRTAKRGVYGLAHARCLGRAC